MWNYNILQFFKFIEFFKLYKTIFKITKYILQYMNIFITTGDFTDLSHCTPPI